LRSTAFCKKGSWPKRYESALRFGWEWAIN
jgi:hypothetical protein